jgi:hypothetical protein
MKWQRRPAYSPVRSEIERTGGSRNRRGGVAARLTRLATALHKEMQGEPFDLIVLLTEGLHLMKVIAGADLKRKGIGAVTALIGYLLSPLSWWNDLFVNVPLALAFAWVVSCFHRGAFMGSFVLGYWLTNVLGLILMQWGAEAVVTNKFKGYGMRQIARDLIIALLYTALIVALVKLHVLAPLPDYLPHRS